MSDRLIMWIICIAVVLVVTYLIAFSFRKKLKLNENEQLILEGSANKWQAIGSKGGKLYLTNQRLVFIAHALNFGSKFNEIPLSNIATAGNTFKFHVSSNAVSFNLTIETKNGGNEKFVITRSQKDLWIQKIGEAILGYVTQNISLPKNSQGHTIAAPQMKVVNCQGCGHFVLVMSGSVAVCEYCGRPAL